MFLFAGKVNKSTKMATLATVFLFIFSLVAAATDTSACIRRDFGKSSFVCVCNANHCDTAPSLPGSLAPGHGTLISSSKDSARFKITNVTFTELSNSVLGNEIFIDPEFQAQKILGFGGAFTDAAGINIGKLSILAQQRLIRAYYSSEGIEYGIARVPMAGTDFSTHTYSYDDFPGDVTLANFSLTTEDLFYKIPYIDWARSYSSKEIKFFASPWSAPAWMKTNNKFYGEGYLLPEYYQVWANYFVRFLEEYAKHKISFWGLTTQNEPMDGTVPGFSFNCMGWTPEDQALFIGLNLGPTLQAKGFGDIKIMILDDQRLLLPKWAKSVLEHPEAKRFVSGIAVHWYGNLLSPAKALTVTHEMFPDHFILSTEACEGDKPWQENVVLGSWERLESYAHDIIMDLNNWVTGWVDWNLVLDEKGGPNWADNGVDAPIIVNHASDEFYKQPMYYAMGHFSKYIPEDSVRIGLTMADDKKLFSTAFKRPDGKIAIVLLNRSEDEKQVTINDVRRGGSLQFLISARSIHTLVYES